MERVLTTLAHREPDRVPFFIPVTIGGARELGISVKEYLAHPESMVEGQIRKNLRYGDDFVCNFSYGAADFEAWGGDVNFCDDGPPTSGEPFLQRVEDILQLEPPRVAEQPCLQRVIEVTKSLKERVGGATPIVGVFISPFSLPVMQMGFEKYLEVIYERPELFEHLVRVNEEFCVQ
jgi:uroporphyrinogen decarboxylase